MLTGKSGSGLCKLDLGSAESRADIMERNLSSLCDPNTSASEQSAACETDRIETAKLHVWNVSASTPKTIEGFDTRPLSAPMALDGDANGTHKATEFAQLLPAIQQDDRSSGLGVRHVGVLGVLSPTAAVGTEA